MGEKCIKKCAKYPHLRIIAWKILTAQLFFSQLECHVNEPAVAILVSRRLQVLASKCKGVRYVL